MGHILQKTSICGMNISDTLSFTSYATILFLQHFDIMMINITPENEEPWEKWIPLYPTTCQE